PTLLLIFGCLLDRIGDNLSHVPRCPLDRIGPTLLLIFGVHWIGSVPRSVLLIGDNL
ncbi:hypothetical protein L9F63_019763, partial [Diploptera punctata]